MLTYWSTTAVSALFLLLAVTAPDVPAGSYAALGFGTLAGAAGSVMATRLALAGVPRAEFHDATSATRVLAVAWLVLVAALVLATLVGSGFGARPSAGPEAVATVLAVADGVAAQVFGAAALFVVVGDGYTKYVRLREAHGSGDSGSVSR